MATIMFPLPSVNLRPIPDDPNADHPMLKDQDPVTILAPRGLVETPGWLLVRVLPDTRSRTTRVWLIERTSNQARE